MARSSIFLNSITCIDHGLINEKGLVVGRSFMLSAIVTGDIPDDDPEQVVIDFSKCKKLIKSCIDDKMTGYDHKLWIDPEYTTTIQVASNRIEVETNSSILDLPLDAVKMVKSNNIVADMGQYIQDHLSKIYSDIHIDVEITLDDIADKDPLYNETRMYFNYVHGLKDSSSFGCQNIAHGHTSYIDVMSPYKVIFPNFHDIIFIFDQNITMNNDIWLTIEYSTKDRGYFKFSINKVEYLKHNVLLKIINTETTIEHLIDVIFNEMKINNQIDYLKVSEGLQKGALYIPKKSD